MEIKIIRPDEETLKEMGVRNWPTWEKEISKFDWYYDETEVCYILEGRIIVETEEGEKYEINEGDLVTFPKGLSCKWEILLPVKKHYKFMD